MSDDLHERRKAVLDRYPCPQCQAPAGKLCTGIRGAKRKRLHEQRWQASNLRPGTVPPPMPQILHVGMWSPRRVQAAKLRMERQRCDKDPTGGTVAADDTARKSLPRPKPTM